MLTEQVGAPSAAWGRAQEENKDALSCESPRDARSTLDEPYLLSLKVKTTQQQVEESRPVIQN